MIIGTSKTLQRTQEQIERLEAEIKQKKQRYQRQRKKEENRLAMLVGTAVLDAVRNNKMSEEEINGFLNRYITSERDRDFLELPRKARPREDESSLKDSQGSNQQGIDKVFGND